ncbi:MAG TPA: hypothetical protein VG650_01280 [Mycobacteriales bacterium]|nr:hypothetical protein [Mycobacteriales bacterium]
MKLRYKSIAVAAATTGALLAAGGATAIGTPHVKRTLLPTPLLAITASKGGTFEVAGPRHFSAGRVNLKLVAGKGEQEVAIARLHGSYSYKDLGRDFATFGKAQDNPTPAALKALNRIVRRTTFFGGLDSGAGHTTVSGSVVLPRAGKYLVLNDATGPGLGGKVALHVSPRVGSRSTPPASAVVRATTSKRFRGSKHLPAAGTIEFKNNSTNSPHFLFLQHVKKGTTRKQVLEALKCQGPKCHGPIRNGSVGTDVVFMGKTMTLTYTLPAGDYAEMCFFPDLKTGMPHALMGMVRIVHLS